MSQYGPANSSKSTSSASQHHASSSTPAGCPKTPGMPCLSNPSPRSEHETIAQPSPSQLEDEWHWSGTNSQIDSDAILTSEPHQYADATEMEAGGIAANATMPDNYIPPTVPSNDVSTMSSTIMTMSDSSSTNSEFDENSMSRSQTGENEYENSVNMFILPDLEVRTQFDFSEFTRIISFEDRQLYKTIFEEGYDEYILLLAHVDAVRHKFHELYDRFLDMPIGSREYHYIAIQIVNEYQRLFTEDELNRKHRFDYLHAKLAHIRRLVQDFDIQICSAQENGTST